MANRILRSRDSVCPTLYTPPVVVQVWNVSVRPPQPPQPPAPQRCVAAVLLQPVAAFCCSLMLQQQPQQHRPSARPLCRTPLAPRQGPSPPHGAPRSWAAAGRQLGGSWAPFTKGPPLSHQSRAVRKQDINASSPPPALAAPLPCLLLCLCVCRKCYEVRR